MVDAYKKCLWKRKSIWLVAVKRFCKTQSPLSHLKAVDSLQCVGGLAAEFTMLCSSSQFEEEMAARIYSLRQSFLSFCLWLISSARFVKSSHFLLESHSYCET